MHAAITKLYRTGKQVQSHKKQKTSLKSGNFKLKLRELAGVYLYKERERGLIV